MTEINAGFEIIAAETYNKRSEFISDRIVLGRKTTMYNTEYVTWESTHTMGVLNQDYYWGHYFDNEAAARADYHERLMQKWEARA